MCVVVPLIPDPYFAMKKWIYFYTPDYAFWHQHLQHTLGGHFKLHPILVQANQLQLNEKEGHHFQGCSLKLELLIQCIAENMGESILFSDCTLRVCGERVDKLQRYVDALSGNFDLVFADNIKPHSKVNIGFMLIQCNSRTLTFWKKLHAAFKEDSWDQQLVNRRLWNRRYLRHLQILSRPGVTWSTFDASRIVCAKRFEEAYRNTYYLYKQHIRSSTRDSNWNQRLKALHAFGLLSDGELSTNLREARQAGDYD